MGENLEMKKLEAAAEQGDMEAQFNLGRMYYNGEGTEVNYEKALYWWEKAAEQGDVRAQYNVGYMYYNGEGTEVNYEKALYWWEKAAEQGDAEAQFNLGRMYCQGEGTEVNYEKALYWWEKAAEQGDVRAQFNVGLIFFRGLGTEVNYEKALYWYEKAAEQGDAKAQFATADMYYCSYGESMSWDKEKALYWYEKAAVCPFLLRGGIIVNLRKPLSFFVAAAMTVTALCSAIGFAEEPGAQPVGEWITNSDGSYTYIQGDDPAAAISSLKLDSSSVGDWSDVQYVSVDISVQGTAQVVLSATVGENWSKVNETVASSETTLTIFTNGNDVPYGVDIGVWQYAEDIYADAGTIITVSNVKFSTELPPRENGVWYEEPDGSLTYTHGDDPTVEVPTIKPNSSSVNDWSAVKYISVDVSVEGKAQVALNSVVGETWTYVSETITSSEKTLVLHTNGKNIPNGIAINVWKYNDTKRS